MSALTHNTPGRAILVALAIGLVGAMMAIAVFPADAAMVNGEEVGRISGDACEALEFQGESFEFDVPGGASNDQTRVFDETYDLGNGVSLAAFLPSNRSYLDFAMTDAWVSAVVVFGRNNQGDGTLYDYTGRPLVTADEGLTSLTTGNIKSVTLCYDTKVRPTISTVATANAAIDGSISDVATLTGGYDAGGSITFEVYLDDDSCPSAALEETWTVTVDGDGDYSPLTAFTPTERGTYYWIASYSGDENNHGVSGTCGDANEISTVFDNQFVCGVPYTTSNSTLGLSATFIRPDGSEECSSADSTKFGNLDFSISDGEDIIQFTPDGVGKATFVGELTYDADGATSYDILHIDDSADGNGTFRAMKWYKTLGGISYDSNGVISGAVFECPTGEDWCILSATIDKDDIVWVIGGKSVDPRFR